MAYHFRPQIVSAMEDGELLDALTGAPPSFRIDVRRELMERLEHKSTERAPLRIELSRTAAREWATRLQDAKERTIGHRRRLLDQADPEHPSNLFCSPGARRNREIMRQKNLEEMEGFLARIDFQISFIEQFADPKASAGKILFERNHEGMKFEGLNPDAQALWEQCAALQASKADK